MPIAWINLLVPVIVALLLPRWMLLIWGIPILMFLSFSNLVPPLFSVADVDIYSFDIVLCVVALRTCMAIGLGSRPLYFHNVYRIIAIYLSVLLAATFWALFRFGEEIFIGEIKPFLRMLAQMSVVFWMAEEVRWHRRVARVERSLRYLGYVIAASIYLNTLLIPSGMRFGEVQVSKEIVRYFGPLGDQVGFILIYFIYRELVNNNLLGATVLEGALTLTGTRGALIALAVGFGVLTLSRRWLFVRNYTRMMCSLFVFSVTLGILVSLDLGGIRSRFLKADMLEAGVGQRMFTMGTAVHVFADNMITGVGYTGFRFVALYYDAERIAMERLGSFSPNFIATAGNQYLQVATDAGVFALVFFVLMVVVFARTLRWAVVHSYGEERACFAASYLYLLSLALGNWSAVWVLPGSFISYLVWVLVGLAVGWQLRVEKGTKTPHGLSATTGDENGGASKERTPTGDARANWFGAASPQMRLG